MYCFPLYFWGLCGSCSLFHVCIGIDPCNSAGSGYWKVQKGESAGSLLMELPEYKMPNARTIAIYVWEKVKDYLSKAGTTILLHP